MKLTKRVFKEDVDPDFFNDAVEQSKISKKNMEDVMKDRTIKLDGTDKEEKVSDKKAIEKAVKDTNGKEIKKGKFDLIESLLKEGYDFRVEDANFNVNVVDRKALAKLVEGLKALGINPFVKKSVKEGYKYNVVIKGIPQRKRVVESKEDVTKETNLKQWYTSNYPTDELGQELNDNVTLGDVSSFIFVYGSKGDDEHGDFYDYVGVSDSVVRERIFNAVAKLRGCDYQKVYDAWMGKGKVREAKENAKEKLILEEVSKPSRDTIIGMLKDGSLDDPEYIKTLNDKEFNELVDYWVDHYNTEDDYSLDESKGIKHNPKQEKKFALEEEICPECGCSPCVCGNPNDKDAEYQKTFAKGTKAWDNEVDKEIGKDKEVKEDLNSNPYKKVIGEYFDYSGDFEFLEVVSDVIDRIDDFGDEQGISEAIDSTLVYYSDQWKVLEHYCTPQDANWETAYEEFSNDIYGLCQHIIDNGLVEGLKEDTEVTIDKVEITEPNVEINKGNGHRHQELAKSLRDEDEFGLLDIEDEDDSNIEFEDEDEFFCTNVPAMIYSTANDDEDRIVLNDVKISTEEKPSKGGAFDFDDEDELITKDTKFDDEEEE